MRTVLYETYQKIYGEKFNSKKPLHCQKMQATVFLLQMMKCNLGREYDFDLKGSTMYSELLSEDMSNEDIEVENFQWTPDARDTMCLDRLAEIVEENYMETVNKELGLTLTAYMQMIAAITFLQEYTELKTANLVKKMKELFPEASEAAIVATFAPATVIGITAAIPRL